MSVRSGATTHAERTAPANGLIDFCRSEHRRLVGMIGLYTGDADLAEEISQETLARVCAHWERLSTADDAARWATRVAFNLAKSRFRRRRTRSAVLDRYGPTLTAANADGDAASAVAVRLAVAGLPERQRLVIVLRYFCDLAVREVAEEMSCAEGTVKSLTALAMEALRRAGLEFEDA